MFPNGKSRPTKGMLLCPQGSWLKTQRVFIRRVTGAFLRPSPGHRAGTFRRGGSDHDRERDSPSRCVRGGGRGQRSLTVLSSLRGSDPGTGGGWTGRAPTGRRGPSPQRSSPGCRPTPEDSRFKVQGFYCHSYIATV